MEVAGMFPPRSPSVAMRNVRPARVRGGADLHRHSLRTLTYEGSQAWAEISCVHILSVKRNTWEMVQVQARSWHEEANILSGKCVPQRSSTHDRQARGHITTACKRRLAFGHNIA